MTFILKIHVFYFEFAWIGGLNAFKIKGFSFLNEVDQGGRTLRIVLQKETESGLLNVAVGFYHIENNKYEVTPGRIWGFFVLYG